MNINREIALIECKNLYYKAMRYFPKSAKRLKLLDEVQELKEYWNITDIEIHSK